MVGYYTLTLTRLPIGSAIYSIFISANIISNHYDVFAKLLGSLRSKSEWGLRYYRIAVSVAVAIILAVFNCDIIIGGINVVIEVKIAKSKP